MTGPEYCCEYNWYQVLSIILTAQASFKMADKIWWNLKILFSIFIALAWPFLKLCNSLHPGDMSVIFSSISKLIVAIKHHKASVNLVNIGSGNGLLPDGTKPLPTPILTNHQWHLVTFTWGKFHRKSSRYLSLTWVWKLLIWDYKGISQGPWRCSGADRGCHNQPSTTH